MSTSPTARSTTNSKSFALTICSSLFMRARISIDPKQQDSSIKILKAVFGILDRISKVKLSTASKTKCERSRKKVQSQRSQDDLEEKDRKQTEKLRVENQQYLDKLRSLPPAEQRKLEEKKRVQDLKKQKSRMQKMVKF